MKVCKGYIMTFNLDSWAPYLCETDRQTIQNFVTDTESGKHLDYCLVFYGTGGNGKSTLLTEICQALGEGASRGLCPRPNKVDIAALAERTVKLVYCNDDIPSAFLKELLAGEDIPNVICLVNTMDSLDVGLIRRSKVINFSHKF